MPPEDARRELAGIGIGRHAVAGPVVRMAPPLPEPSTAPGTEPADVALGRARAALTGVAETLRARGAAAGGEAADVLDAQALMAEDPALDDMIAAGVTRGLSAARAVFEAFAGFREALAAAGPYLAERVADLDDVRQRAVAACLGVPVPGVPDPGHPFVLVARDLAPADTAGLDLTTVLALVTADGGPTSHTAVLARSRGIPAVVGCAGVTDLDDGTDSARRSGRVPRDRQSGRVRVAEERRDRGHCSDRARPHRRRRRDRAPRQRRQPGRCAGGGRGGCRRRRPLPDRAAISRRCHGSERGQSGRRLPRCVRRVSGRPGRRARARCRRRQAVAVPGARPGDQPRSGGTRSAGVAAAAGGAADPTGIDRDRGP